MEQHTLLSFALLFAGLTPTLACPTVNMSQPAYIESPNYPTAYPNNENCVWQLQTTPGMQIQIDVLDLQLEGCCDHVDVYDSWVGGNHVTRLSSNGTINVLSSEARVVFSSDGSVTFNGFQLYWSAATGLTTPEPVCRDPMEVIDESGFIESPNYPNQYMNSLNCVWLIGATFGNQIQINVLDLQLEPCCDHVDVYDSWVGGNNVTRLSSNATFSVDSNEVRVVFSSDGSVTDNGFQLSWSAATEPITSGPVCQDPMEVTGESGTIESPNYPNQYMNSLNCVWLIGATFGNQIQINVQDLQLEPCCDHVDVYDSWVGGSQVIRLASTGLINVPSSEARVVFSSDSSITYNGFQLSWSAGTGFTTPGPVCQDPMEVIAESGVIESPYYPNLYLNNLACVWLIGAAFGNQIRIDVMDLQLESCCDHVDIYDSWDGENHVMRISSTGPIVVRSTEARVVFVSDYSVTRQGFHLTWLAEYTSTSTTEFPDVPCQEPVSITDGSGYISSPGYPDFYQEYLHCTWHIYSTEGNKIRLHFLDFSLEYHYDNLLVYPDIGNPDDPLAVLTGRNQSIDDMVVHGNFVRLELSTDGSVGGRGFEIYWAGETVYEDTTPTTTQEWTTTNEPPSPIGDCGIPAFPPHLNYGRVINGQESTPYSWPWQVSLQAGSHFCGGSLIDDQWVLTARHCVVHASVDDFVVIIGAHHLPNPGPSAEEYLVTEIHLHPDGWDTALLKLNRAVYYRPEVSPVCLSETQAPDGMECFVTGWGVLDPDASSTAEDLQQASQVIINHDLCNSPEFYNGGVRTEEICAGHVHGNSSACYGDSGGPLVCNFHGVWYLTGVVSRGHEECAYPNKPPIYASVLSNMEWIADVTCGTSIPTSVRGQCESVEDPMILGGNEGALTTPGRALGMHYFNNAQCAWRIVTRPGFVITLTVEDMAIENESTCDYDALTIYDGHIINEATSFGTFCGYTNPGSLTSTTNAMYVTFTTDGSVTDYGASLRYTVSESNATPNPEYAQCGHRWNRSPARIVGGEVADPNSIPWQVSLRSTTDPSWHFCGGSIANQNWIITAAHCVRNTDPDSLLVVTGEHQIYIDEGFEQTHIVAEVIVHSQYGTPGSSNNDIALLRLATPLVFDDKRSPVCLPANPVQPGTYVMVSGFGETQDTGEDYVLTEVQVPIVSNEDCNDGAYGGSITDDMICAGEELGGVDSCQGDSGGPLVSEVGDQHILQGVVSWGYGCALPGYPGVYANVHHLVDWLTTNSRDELTTTY